jgi:signal transduction histidine kinase
VEPFYQVETSTTRRYEGAGLGLALVNAMIKAHGGVLSLDGELNRGTATMLRFPPARTVAQPRHRSDGQSQAA